MRRSAPSPVLTSPVLEVKDLQIAFGGVKAVDGLSFTADTGGRSSR